MSWEHGTYGWEAYESAILALRAAGITCREETKKEGYVRGQDAYNDDIQHLRFARFTATNGTPMVVEEYLKVKDTDCDGRSYVGIGIYREGSRPPLTTQVLRWEL